MQIAGQINQKPVSYMAPDILHKNVSPSVPSELSTLIVGLLRTAGATPYPRNNLTGRRGEITSLIKQ